jgi:hypothetical protein
MEVLMAVEFSGIQSFNLNEIRQANFNEQLAEQKRLRNLERLEEKHIAVHVEQRIRVHEDMRERWSYDRVGRQEAMRKPEGTNVDVKV